MKLISKGHNGQNEESRTPPVIDKYRTSCTYMTKGSHCYLFLLSLTFSLTQPLRTAVNIGG